ncbi:MAG TPA: dienelactone hydrolase family protein [Chitinispirillaceae bacterium]|jgi:dienelactone hydrolase|nr:dienelactone hydrolase family protein [Chitinispirillaceae bacterium]
MAFEREMEHEVRIPVISDDVNLSGSLYIPETAQGLVLFVHGSGSSRFSPRNRFVAQYLNNGAYATLLFDLLTRSEEAADLISANLRFDIDLLARRLSAASDWVASQPDLKTLPLGYFGASTGAAAAISASVGRTDVKAIVSRGGRPDMAGMDLGRISAPILLIVGGDDYQVLELNRRAFEAIRVPAKKLEIVPGATHLFEEPGALDEVARLAVDWYMQYLH